MIYIYRNNDFLTNDLIILYIYDFDVSKQRFNYQ